MCPITINKALLLQEGILRFELSWTAVSYIIYYKPLREKSKNGQKNVTADAENFINPKL